jgi:putative tryptophan/tyrosine transport system substrate-binding protein
MAPAAALTVILTVALLAAPLAAEAQRAGRVYRVGFLIPGAPSVPSDRATLSLLIPAALRELGYVEGQSLLVERRYAGGKRDRLSELARDLVQLRVDVIVTVGNEAIQAAKDATKTIPIVMIGGSVVARGLVASLAQPGGNVTGVAITETTLAAKRLEILKEAVPRATRIAILTTVEEYQQTQLREAQEAAATLGVALVVVEARGLDYGSAFARMVSERAQALLVFASPLLHRDRSRIMELAAKHRLPAIYQWREHAEEGGLMAYGSNLAELSRRMAAYVDRILKGARPAELPVEQPTVYELVINLRTAKALGLTIPPSVLARADEIIE